MMVSLSLSPSPSPSLSLPPLSDKNTKYKNSSFLPPSLPSSQHAEKEEEEKDLPQLNFLILILRV